MPKKQLGELMRVRHNDTEHYAYLVGDAPAKRGKVCIQWDGSRGQCYVDQALVLGSVVLGRSENEVDQQEAARRTSRRVSVGPSNSNNGNKNNLNNKDKSNTGNDSKPRQAEGEERHNREGENIVTQRRRKKKGDSPNNRLDNASDDEAGPQPKVSAKLHGARLELPSSPSSLKEVVVVHDDSCAVSAMSDGEMELEQPGRTLWTWKQTNGTEPIRNVNRRPTNGTRKKERPAATKRKKGATAGNIDNARSKIRRVSLKDERGHQEPKENIFEQDDIFEFRSSPATTAVAPVATKPRVRPHTAPARSIFVHRNHSSRMGDVNKPASRAKSRAHLCTRTIDNNGPSANRAATAMVGLGKRRKGRKVSIALEGNEKPELERSNVCGITERHDDAQGEQAPIGVTTSTLSHSPSAVSDRHDAMKSGSTKAMFPGEAQGEQPHTGATTAALSHSPSAASARHDSKKKSCPSKALLPRKAAIKSNNQDDQAAVIALECSGGNPEKLLNSPVPQATSVDAVQTEEEIRGELDEPTSTGSHGATKKGDAITSPPYDAVMPVALNKSEQREQAGEISQKDFCRMHVTMKGTPREEEEEAVEAATSRPPNEEGPAEDTASTFSLRLSKTTKPLNLPLSEGFSSPVAAKNPERRMDHAQYCVLNGPTESRLQFDPEKRGSDHCEPHQKEHAIEVQTIGADDPPEPARVSTEQVAETKETIKSTATRSAANQQKDKMLVASTDEPSLEPARHLEKNTLHQDVDDAGEKQETVAAPSACRQKILVEADFPWGNGEAKQTTEKVGPSGFCQSIATSNDFDPHHGVDAENETFPSPGDRKTKAIEVGCDVTPSKKGTATEAAARSGMSASKMDGFNRTIDLEINEGDGDTGSPDTHEHRETTSPPKQPRHLPSASPYGNDECPNADPRKDEECTIEQSRGATPQGTAIHSPPTTPAKNREFQRELLVFPEAETDDDHNHVSSSGEERNDFAEILSLRSKSKHRALASGFGAARDEIKLRNSAKLKLCQELRAIQAAPWAAGWTRDEVIDELERRHLRYLLTSTRQELKKELNTSTFTTNNGHLVIHLKQGTKRALTQLQLLQGNTFEVPWHGSDDCHPCSTALFEAIVRLLPVLRRVTIWCHGAELDLGHVMEHLIFKGSIDTLEICDATLCQSCGVDSLPYIPSSAKTVTELRLTHCKPSETAEPFVLEQWLLELATFAPLRRVWLDQVDGVSACCIERMCTSLPTLELHLKLMSIPPNILCFPNLSKLSLVDCAGVPEIVAHKKPSAALRELFLWGDQSQDSAVRVFGQVTQMTGLEALTVTVTGGADLNALRIDYLLELSRLKLLRIVQLEPTTIYRCFERVPNGAWEALSS
jgi:hypothetical protein